MTDQLRETRFIRRFEDVSLTDIDQVGGKNASLGEMIRCLQSKRVDIPPGFATTAAAYWEFLRMNDLERQIRDQLERLGDGEATLEAAGSTIRGLILEASLPDVLMSQIREAYEGLAASKNSAPVAVAVRSSATAEDLPEASFAGQQESFLNVTGVAEVLDACLRCYASLFTDRAISYRENLGYDHLQVAISVGIQRMVRSDQGSAGVMFTLDPESGMPGVVVINAAWGLGEGVVKGTVNPDQYTVFKGLLDSGEATPVLDRVIGSKEEKFVCTENGGIETVSTSSDERAQSVLTHDEIVGLARWGLVIEEHYGRAMDIEWAKDGVDGGMFIVQARPETVWSQRPPVHVTYTLTERVLPLLSGLAVGNAVATGRVHRVQDATSVRSFPEGSVLVAERTDPDWGPFLPRAVAVVTDRGGRTSHAAIVSRELGVPAVVGSATATSVLKDGMAVTVSCAEGDRGFVYPGTLPFHRTEIPLDDVPEIDLPVMMNIANPGVAFRSWALPARGIGLARLEFLIGDVIRVHPMALVRPEILPAEEQREIERIIQGWADGSEYFVERLAAGVARIAASVFPHPTVVRTSDFKTNEYAKLLGGATLEMAEENPMIGFRGASRYTSDQYREAFMLECHALRRAREYHGMTNIIPMIPFCRTLNEADQVLALMAEANLERGRNGLQIYVMCEIPSNVILAEEFAARFDGFSIGSNDLTQLTLGVDRDNAELADLFDESDPAVLRSIERVIGAAHEMGRTVGFCGQAPSNDPAYAEFLSKAGIDSISVDPDSVVEVTRRLAALNRGVHHASSGH